MNEKFSKLGFYPSDILLTGREVVLVEVDHADEAVADLAVALAALDVDEGVLERFEDAFAEILAHVEYHAAGRSSSKRAAKRSIMAFP